MDRVAADVPKPVFLSEYAPPDHVIDTVDLLVQIDDRLTRVTTTLKGRANPDASAGERPLILHGNGLSLQSVRLNGESVDLADVQIEGEELRLSGVGESFELITIVEIKPEENTALEGLYKAGGLYCTQCEPEGFRRITYFPDRPDVLAVYTVRIEADKVSCPVLLANGNKIEEGELEEGRHFAVWHDPFPKPSYLFAMVAGDLGPIEDSFTTASGREVALQIFVEHGNEAKADHAMDSLKRSMKWDEEVYGLEYDLDIFMIVAVSAFNMGAMENKGLNIFNDKFVLADPETATDADYQRIEAIIAHEYFHNWTGNRVTCRDWFQLSLKEGLTVFRDQEFTADTHSRGVKRVDDVRLLRTAQFPEDAGPTSHSVRPDSYIEINNFYTVTIYEKGAEVIRMMHTLLGPERYRKGIDLYFERHDGQAVTCDDFAQAMEDASGVDLSVLRRWYAQAGTPKLTASWRGEGADALTLTLSQMTPPTPGQANKHPVGIPVKIAFFSPEGEQLSFSIDGGERADEQVVEIREARETYHVAGKGVGQAVPSLLRGFSAPVNLETDWTRSDLAFLAGVDTDPFNRFEAMQRLATDTINSMVEAKLKGEQASIDQDLLGAFERTLADESLEPAFKAELLSLPGQSLIGQHMGVWHVDEVFDELHRLEAEIGRSFADLFQSLYHEAKEAAGDGLTSAAMGQRSLERCALNYLVASGAEQAVQLAFEAASTSPLMTRMMMGLATLNDIDCVEREQALQAFHDRFVDNPLVLDKWFGLRATTALPTALDDVRELMSHDGFSMKNPNRVRALVGAFAMGNPKNFHALDGSGYRFLADRVIELDAINPQVAARLSQPLVRWKRFSEERGALMTGELRRIMDKPGLSKDVTEIVSKGLG